MTVWINKSSHLICSGNQVSGFCMQNWTEMVQYKKFCAECAEK